MVKLFQAPTEDGERVEVMRDSEKRGDLDENGGIEEMKLEGEEERGRMRGRGGEGKDERERMRGGNERGSTR